MLIKFILCWQLTKIFSYIISSCLTPISQCVVDAAFPLKAKEYLPREIKLLDVSHIGAVGSLEEAVRQLQANDFSTSQWNKISTSAKWWPRLFALYMTICRVLHKKRWVAWQTIFLNWCVRNNKPIKLRLWSRHGIWQKLELDFDQGSRGSKITFSHVTLTKHHWPGMMFPSLAWLLEFSLWPETWICKRSTKISPVPGQWFSSLLRLN